uniref:Uncharacterized protein n=1 Tax=Phakopsora pachyrhizi TaxID=170000 RepID=A0A0S1MIK7_PHAPC
MKLTFLTSLFVTGIAFAAAKAPLADNAPCKKDGSLGVCQSGLCEQQPNAPQGTCKAK